MLNHQFPVYAVKISDNVAMFEDEPVMLIVAHIHAEEVAGLEATIKLMQKMVTNQEPYRTIRNQSQLYAIPTMNPDGLEVILLGSDNYWRKNGYIPPELHLDSCVVVQGMGEDSRGVDLNRNFDINWIYGDTLFVRENVEPFDYFRGPAPFSEPSRAPFEILRCRSNRRHPSFGTRPVRATFRNAVLWRGNGVWTAMRSSRRTAPRSASSIAREFEDDKVPGESAIS